MTNCPDCGDVLLGKGHTCEPTHKFAVEISHSDYENIDQALDGCVADEIAQIICEYLPAFRVSVKEIR